MNKLSELLNKAKEKFKSMKTSRKIALGVVVVGIIVSIILLVSYNNANKYGVLFSNLSSEDGNTITQKLKDEKIDYKVDGNTIYVPKAQVSELKLEMSQNLTDGSKGYELLDNSSSLGMTDAQFDLNKQRAIQGELEKTIKSIPQIESARVLISPSQDSAFVTDKTPAKAAVYLALKAGNKLTDANVKSIVALVSASVENLPKENVQVIDDKMNLLSKNISSDDNNSAEVSSEAIKNNQDLESNFNKKLEDAVMDVLAPVVGSDKVKVKVNADLDFDSKQNSTITYDPNAVIASSHIVKENDTNNSGAVSQSPTNNNTNSNTTTSNGGATTTTKEDSTVNNKVGESDTKTISAPGEVKRLTASVAIDGKLDAATKTSIQDLVSGVIGYNQARGDVINVVGLTFDQTSKTQAQAEIQAMKDADAAAKKAALYRNIVIGAVAGVVLIALLIILLRRRKKNDEENAVGEGLNVVIDDNVQPKEAIKFESLDLDAQNEKSFIEEEIKKYATSKPEQVADIVKSWLAEDER